MAAALKSAVRPRRRHPQKSHSLNSAEKLSFAPENSLAFADDSHK